MSKLANQLIYIVTEIKKHAASLCDALLSPNELFFLEALLNVQAHKSDVAFVGCFKIAMCGNVPISN